VANRGPISIRFSERNKFAPIKQVMGGVTRDFMEQQAQEIVDVARSLAPVWTGYLKSSITYDLVGSNQWQWAATITAQAPYAIYQEFGTKFMPAHPFLRPAMDQVAQNLPQDLKERVDQAIARVGWGNLRWELEL
jgi:HK97 gp10 family phage protein